MRMHSYESFPYKKLAIPADLIRNMVFAGSQFPLAIILYYIALAILYYGYYLTRYSMADHDPSYLQAMDTPS
jgi:hypothetical protein